MKWISVNDSLPEPNSIVLTHSSEYGEIIGYRDSADDNDWTSEYMDYETGEPWLTAANVTHWMPLPEPPKETK